MRTSAATQNDRTVLYSATVAWAKDVFGPYENNPANPVITHRHMGFRCPIGNVGHADLVELPDGSWYAVMLASRVIDGAYKNLGRETYICPWCGSGTGPCSLRCDRGCTSCFSAPSAAWGTAVPLCGA